MIFFLVLTLLSFEVGNGGGEGEKERERERGEARIMINRFSKKIAKKKTRKTETNDL